MHLINIFDYGYSMVFFLISGIANNHVLQVFSTHYVKASVKSENSSNTT